MSPSPPGGPAAHRVAIISFPVTKEVQILWSPHRGGEGSGEAALEPLAHTQRGGRDDDADPGAARPRCGLGPRHAAAMGQRPGRASAALPGVRLHGWSGRQSRGVSPGAEPPPPVPRWANRARSSSSSSSNSSYPEPRPRGGEGGGGGRRPCCCRLAARGAGRGTERGGDGRREAEERRGRDRRRLRAGPTLINSRGAGGSRGPPPVPRPWAVPVAGRAAGEPAPPRKRQQKSTALRCRSRAFVPRSQAAPPSPPPGAAGDQTTAPRPPPLPRASVPLHPSAAASGRPARPCPRPGAIRRRQLRPPRCRPPGHRPPSRGGGGWCCRPRGRCGSATAAPPGDPVSGKTNPAPLYCPYLPPLSLGGGELRAPLPRGGDETYPELSSPAHEPAVSVASENPPASSDDTDGAEAGRRALPPSPPLSLPSGRAPRGANRRLSALTEDAGSAAGPAAHLAARARDGVRPAGACGRRTARNELGQLPLVSHRHATFKIYLPSGPRANLKFNPRMSRSRKDQS